MLSIGTIAAKVFGTSTIAGSSPIGPMSRPSTRSSPSCERLSDAELRARTETVSQAAGRRRRRSTICWCRPSPPCARRPSVRLGQRHFDVQLIGGMVLHQGKISEMKTGEGKTLVATLPVYLNALAGARRARRHGQRLPGQARRRSGWAASTSSWASPSASSCTSSMTTSGARSTPATSPTPPTTSWASTTCATT